MQRDLVLDLSLLQQAPPQPSSDQLHRPLSLLSALSRRHLFSSVTATSKLVAERSHTAAARRCLVVAAVVLFTAVLRRLFRRYLGVILHHHLTSSPLSPFSQLPSISLSPSKFSFLSPHLLLAADSPFLHRSPTSVFLLILKNLTW